MQVLHSTKPVTVGAPQRHTARLHRTAPLQPAQRSVIVRFKEGEDSGSRAEQQVKERLSDVQQKVSQGGQTGPSDSLPQVNPATSAFTRRREVFVGRLAMIGFIAGCTAEIMQAGHPNILVQVSNYLGGMPVGPRAVALIVGGIVAWNTVTALNPSSPTWSEENQRDVSRRPTGPTNDPRINVVSEPATFLGLSGWGFTKANEVLHGRLAMLGFAGTILNQIVQGGYYGPGPLAHLAAFLGTTPTESFYASVTPAFISWSILCIALAYVNNQPGERQGGDDIY